MFFHHPFGKLFHKKFPVGIFISQIQHFYFFCNMNSRDFQGYKILLLNNLVSKPSPRKIFIFIEKILFITFFFQLREIYRQTLLKLFDLYEISFCSSKECLIFK